MKQILLATLAVSLCGVARADKLVVGYLPNWHDLSSLVSTIEYDKLTHLDLAFANPIDDGGTLSWNPSDALVIEAAHAHHVKAMISIGGGGVSEDSAGRQRYFDLISDAKRAGFVQKLVDYVRVHRYDGIDVDLEGAAINKDYGAFVHDLAQALHRAGKTISAALSQGNGGDQVPASALADLDFVNLMAYDATGPWDLNHPGPHSSFAMAKETVDYWVGRGLPKKKAILGVPFYGYGFGASHTKDDFGYAELVAAYPGAENLDQVGNTIYYNGIPTIKAKAKYVMDQGLGGMMIWAIDTDVKGPKSLLGAMTSVLRP